MSNYRKTPTVFQMEAAECGAASLSMILGYFGRHVPLEQMRIETGVSRDGCNAANLMRAAKRFGLECHGYRKESEALKEIQTPCIIHWCFNHFVVFEGCKGKSAYINDPAFGRRRLSWEELNDCFTGVVLTFAKTDAFRTERKTGTPWAFAASRLKGQQGVLFKLFYVGLLLVFPGLVLPLLARVFLDEVFLGGSIDWLPGILAAMEAMIALKAGLTYYRSVVLQRLRSKLTLTSGLAFIQHLFRLPADFFDQRYAGDLVSRMDSNTAVNAFLAGDLAETVLNVLAAAFYLAVLFLYSPVMTLIGLANTALLLLIVFLSHRAVAGISMKMQISGGRLFGTVCAGIGIADTIRASGAEDAYTSRILGCQAQFAQQEQGIKKIQNITDAIPVASGAVTQAMLLLAGGILAIRGQITLGMLVAFLLLFDSFLDPVNRLVRFTQKIQIMRSDVSRVEDLSKYKPDERYLEKAGATAGQSKLSGNIELRDVCFGYNALQPPLIEHISFSLRSGESIAFVGASGCGKSTIAKVVGGLYQPWSGSVLLDGIPLSSIPKAVANASIAMVDQNITLFSGSIRDALTLWNPAVLEEDMIEAAKDACIHDDILQLPGGYSCTLSEDGANFSGGQRQRLEIARALTAKPSVLILDEATSALDPIVEKKILDNIKRRGCTCVIAAHRLSTIRDANQIVVMKNGRIVQTGDHNTLMEQEGCYRTLVQSN